VASAVKLNRLGLLTMNNPARERLLLGYVASTLQAIDPSPAGRALVIGCGQGTDIEIALDRFDATEVVAIDIDPRQVERARRRMAPRDRVSIETGDVLALAWPDGSFDTVFDLGAVHLVPEWRAAYAEIGRVLRPGGKLRFETIVGRSFRAAMRISTAGFATPATAYTEATVVDAMRDAGLRCADEDIRRPRAIVLTGLVGDLIGVATKVGT
jgi:SAM-dependent methyltransferase